jgi:peroxiredoxin
VRLAAALALLLVASAAWAAGPAPLAAGAPAPDTTLPDQRGQAVRLADLLKQREYVVVAFYVKAFTGG